MDLTKSKYFQKLSEDDKKVVIKQVNDELSKLSTNEYVFASHIYECGCISVVEDDYYYMHGGWTINLPCPTCKQKCEQDKKDNIVKKLKSRVKIYEAQIEQLQSKKFECLKLIDEFERNMCPVVNEKNKRWEKINIKNNNYHNYGKRFETIYYTYVKCL